MQNYTPKVSTAIQNIAQILSRLWLFSLENCKSMRTDSQPAAPHHGPPVHIFNMEVNKMHPNINYPNHPATSCIPVKQAWWTGVAVLGHTSHRKNSPWVDT